MIAAALMSTRARTSGSTRLQVLNVSAAARTARSASAASALHMTPTTRFGSAGLTELNVSLVATASPAIHNGYVRPSWDLTSARASSMRRRGSGCVKST
ncbi:MAG: hypothetical protein FLDDKLPJ_02128 [Phycisphaerae bacterium]|nr:hypothetical protein [Phycisphaerae bacterium]